MPVSYARVFKAANNAIQGHLVRQAVKEGVSVRSVRTPNLIHANFD